MRRTHAIVQNGPNFSAPVWLRAAVFALCALLTPPAFALSLASVESEVSAEPAALVARADRAQAPASGDRWALPRHDSPRSQSANLCPRRALLHPGHVLDNGSRAPLRC